MEFEPLRIGYDDCKEIFYAIANLLMFNGFEWVVADAFVKPSTGCKFEFSTIEKYKSVLEFQLDWSYTYPED